MTASEPLRVVAVIAAFNEGPHIREVVLGARPHVDAVIVVDDGSTDDTAAYVATVADHRVRFLHQQNRGLAAARNVGIRAARAPYVAFLDHDDRFAPDKLARQAAVLDARPAVGVVYTGWRHIDASGRAMRETGWDRLDGDVLPTLLARRDARLAVLGTGEPRLEEFFARLQTQFSGRVCFYKGFSNELAHLIEAGSDMFLMPSRYEPCGLNQMYSLKYGTVPIVRKTGGLADTVQPFNPATGEGTGFVFEHFTQAGLRWALDTAFEIWPDRKAWKKLVTNGMNEDWSWDAQGKHYVDLYAKLSGRGER
jgi:glycosyltransferase involved in cell wall biosynthesis